MRGSVYHRTEHQFPNGAKGVKLLVQLNSPSRREPYLFVQTTSQPHNRPKTPGCLPRHSAFYVEAGKPFFDVDTWIQLDRVYEFVPAFMVKEGLKGTLNELGTLPNQMMNAIANCCKYSDDITAHQLQLIMKSKEK